MTADGFFHAAGWFVTLAGLFLLADVRRRALVIWGRWVRSVIVGVGFLQLFDGVIDHKVLQIPQIRYGVDFVPYDVLWIGSAVLVLLTGLVTVWRTRPSRSQN